jgi:hypothetical protein
VRAPATPDHPPTVTPPARRATAYAEDLWQRLCYAKGYLPSSPPPSWRALYRFNRELLQALLTQHTFEQRANLPALRLGLRVFV